MVGEAEGGASAEEAGRSLWGARVAVRAELRPPPGSARESSEEEEGGWELAEGRRLRPPALLAPVPVVAPLTTLVAALRPALEPYLPGAGPYELWLSTGAEAVPLRWHCPAGVIFDLFGGPTSSPSPCSGAGAGADPGVVLWEVGVHCGGLPRGELLPFGGGLGPRDYYFNAMKEAAFVLHGSSAGVQSLLEPARAALWGAASEGDREAHGAALRAAKLSVALAGAAAPGGGAGGGARPPSTRVPVRAYLAPASPEARGGAPIPLTGGWGAVECVTVALEVLHTGEGGGAACEPGDGLPPPVSSTSSGDEGGRAAPFVAALSHALGLRPGVQSEPGFRVVVGGVEIPPAAEVAWVYSALHFPDLWLHVTVWVPPAAPALAE